MDVLIIEDDKVAAESLSQGLTEQGYAVEIAHDGITGLTKARKSCFLAIIIDRMLPGLDGVSVVKTLRQESNTTPILMLTAMSEVDEKVKGFDAGVDDYLTKPFAFAELMARLNAISKRSPNNERNSQIHVGELSINIISREVLRAGQELRLKPREFELLHYFAMHVNQPVSREMLLKDVWKLDFDPQTNIVDVHISRLRQKIDHGFRDPLIRTVRGVGYIFGTE